MSCPTSKQFSLGTQSGRSHFQLDAIISTIPITLASPMSERLSHAPSVSQPDSKPPSILSLDRYEMQNHPPPNPPTLGKPRLPPPVKSQKKGFVYGPAPPRAPRRSSLTDNRASAAQPELVEPHKNKHRGSNSALRLARMLPVALSSCPYTYFVGGCGGRVLHVAS